MQACNYVILGGGLAGLCAAKRLLELGVQPLVIEAGNYPTHKVCGEFLSPSSLPILNQWDIHPVPIYQLQMHTASQQFQLKLSHPAGSLSHWTLDSQLATQISQQGALVLTQTRVIELIPANREGEFHTLLLSSGEQVKAKHLLIATGRLLQHSLQKFQPRYVGFKSHFSGLTLDANLYMFSFKDAYLGIAPIEEGKANLACLAKIAYTSQFSSSQAFMQHLISSHPKLKQLLASGHSLFDNWMETLIPEFGLKLIPDWPHTYWMGDAAATVPPACGNGLSLAITSGYLAAEFAIKQDPLGFKQLWRKRCLLQMYLAKRLHQFCLTPSMGSFALHICQCFPFIARQLFNLTRDRGI